MSEFLGHLLTGGSVSRWGVGWVACLATVVGSLEGTRPSRSGPRDWSFLVHIGFRLAAASSCLTRDARSTSSRSDHRSFLAVLRLA